MLEATLTLTLIAVFASVALIAGSVVYTAYERTSPARRRVQGLVGQATKTAASGRLTRSVEETSQFLTKVSTFIPRSPSQMGRLRKRLATAGLLQPWHAATFVLAEVALAALGFAAPIFTLGSTTAALVWAVLAAIVGFLMPGLWLDRRIKQRQKAIENGLPDALDLFIVCLEAGLALDGAILKSSEELVVSHPALAEELRLVNVEMRAGKPRLDAFRNFAARTKVDDVRALVAMLVQTDRFGTSVAQALRTHAEVARTKRRQRAEERAAKIGVKLVFPLVFCLFPAFYVVTLGPAIIKFAQAFGSGGYLTGGIGGLR